VPKKKLIRFGENLTFPHLFQPRYHELLNGFYLKGKWHSDYFRNNNPIVVELGCGKGEYTVGLAENCPGRNYIGIDVKGARLWRGCKTSQEKKLFNVAFIRTLVDHIEKIFLPHEISEIWITFPDPQLKKPWKRLTSPEFLARYRNILVQGGMIHLKTDNFELFEYTLEIIRGNNHQLLFSTKDLYGSGIKDDVILFQTFYEKIWLEEGKKIFYLTFRLSK
jgi:tRNA (guanine-N7-)-methyltransferase